MNAIAPHNINLLELPSLPLECYKTLPKCAAVYMVLSSENKVLYIGQSVNIQNRWRSHHRRKRLIKIPGLRIAWLQVSDFSLLESIELALIQFFTPKLNRPISTKNRKPNTALIKLRQNNGLTQKQVASFVGVTVQSVSNWETGLTEPLLTISQTLALCRVLQCSLEELDAQMNNSFNTSGDSDPQNPPTLSEM